MSSKFGEIRPWTTELAALERLKKCHRFIMEKMTSSHFLCYISSDPFHAWMSSKFGQIRPLVSMVTNSVIIGKRCCHFFSVLDVILFILTGNDDIHKSLDELEIRPDPTTDHRVSCPQTSEN